MNIKLKGGRKKINICFFHLVLLSDVWAWNDEYNVHFKLCIEKWQIHFSSFKCNVHYEGIFLISRGKKVLFNAIFEQKSNLPNNPKMSVIFLGFCKKGRGSAFLVSTNPFISCRVVAMCTFRVRGSKCKVVYQGN